ncbi:MAG: ATP-dependent Clp protease proteolytic subunit [Solobacterium sp.]|nr:ATP-dependent Clp protease proteolytic subunit [Solobacterium sp.]
MAHVPNKAITLSGKDYVMNTLDIAYANRELYLTGEVNDEMSRAVCSSLRDLARESKEDITLYIQGPGGSVTAGLAIYDTCRAIGCDIRTVACGMAASMSAFLVTCAGTKGKRYIQPHAEMMIHQPLGGASGQASDVRIHAQHVLNVRDQLNAMLAECTGQSLQTIEQDTERDHFMRAEEAVSYGLADHIGEPFSEW